MKQKSVTIRRKTTLLQKLIVVPYSVWGTLFILVPLIFIAYYAFTDNDYKFTLDNLTSFFTTKSMILSDSGEEKEVFTYLLIFWRSFKLALISTVVCLILGYPLAYIMSKASPTAQKTLVTLIMIPMWMNFLIRTYAWMNILKDSGIINHFLELIGMKTVHIIGTEAAVIIGMVYDFFPYMVLPIYSVMAKMDPKLIEAARDLGCNNAGVFRRVILPLSMPGVSSGTMMVLIPSISTFYISQKLGSGKFFLIGDAIEGQYTANNLHFAAAIAFIMMIVLLIVMAIFQRYTNKQAEGGKR